MTSPITNLAFRETVFALLDRHMKASDSVTDSAALPMPMVPSITPQYTGLLPDPSTSSLIVVTSSWVDVGSVDPIVAHVSRQVLNQEVAYAAFCGINNVIIQGPEETVGETTYSNLAQYSRAVAFALGIGPSLQLHISLTLGEIEPVKLQDLRRWVRIEHLRPVAAGNEDDMSPWDAWDTIRSICRYNGRLSVGTQNIPNILQPSKRVHSLSPLSLPLLQT